ncbi:hypothetical protein S245_032748 [Arachis hypogaea]
MDKSRLEIMIHSMRRMWFYSTTDSRSNKRDKEDTSINNMPHTLSLPDQVKLVELLERESVDIIQTEGGKCSNPTKYGVLGLIEKLIEIQLPRGFNDAVNGFVEDGWSLLGNDRIEDVTIAVNAVAGCSSGFACLTRSEWVDYGVDAYSAACFKATLYAVPCARTSGFPGTQGFAYLP